MAKYEENDVNGVFDKNNAHLEARWSGSGNDEQKVQTKERSL
jgi:hypothetical protein